MPTVEGLETVPYGLSFRQPYVSARGQLEGRELILVRLRADGIEALGEAAPLALRGGPGIASIAAELERCDEALRGADVSMESIPELLDRCAAAGASLQARAAVDIAFHDLVGKAAGEPVWSLLGAGRAAPVPCNATLTADLPNAVAQQAESWAARGFTTFKLKVGTPGDVGQVEAVRAVAGEEARIRVDANAVWSEAEAIRRLGVMEPHGLELAEQPVAGPEAMARVREAVATPLSADEDVVTAPDAARAVELGACDMATVKLAKAGGIRAALAVADELPVYLSSALDGPVGIAAAAHAAQAIADAGHAHGLATGELFAERIAVRECVPDGAALQPSDAPGLGVEIDEGALERRRL